MSVWDQFEPVLVIGATIAVFVAIINSVLHLEKNRKTSRHPLTNGLARFPGYSLSQQVSDIQLDLMGHLMGLMFVPIVLYAVYLKSASDIGGFIVAVVFVGCYAYLIRMFMKDRKKLVHHRLGLDCERAVGQELSRVGEHGFYVFHDFPADNFNIDHIVVGPTGVFAVETKGRSKPVRGKGAADAKVIFDGKSLQFPINRETKPVDQAVAQAEWLKRWISSAVGEAVGVKPVLVLPGWFVERTGRGEVVVYNGKSPDKVFPKLNNQVLDSSIIKRINHQLDQRCRIDIAG
ncbi:NERD domain-containing protein [Pseudomonadota bacterium]